MSGLEIADIRVLDLPLTTSFRGLTTRELVVFKGSKRWAEFSAFVEYDDQEAANWLKAALSFANDDLPEIKREWIPVNATLPAVPLPEVDSVLGSFPGFRTVKIKVSENPGSKEQDLARIRHVFENYPGTKIRLDANGALRVNEAIEIIEELGEIKLQYFEQPVRTIGELSQLREEIARRGLKTKIAADESIRKVSDPLRVAKEQAADIAVLKVQPLGGIASAAAIAKQSGLEVVVSSALESSLGIVQGLYLAASLDSLDYDCGLWTQNLLADDIVAEPLEVLDASIKVSVPEIDLDKLERYRVTDDREKFWLERIERCRKLLEA
ncbi:MAG TPA: o-succinylbenzoate synthase [Aquiluna sp.]